MQNSKLPVTVAILLGGQSRRFGFPKAFLPWKEGSLAAHVVRSASRWAEEVLIVGKEMGQVPPDALGQAKFVEDVGNQPGPMAGLVAALGEAKHPWVYVSGVDMPFLNRRVVKGLLEEADPPDSFEAVVPHLHGQWEPLCALWNKRSLRWFQSYRWRSFQQLLAEGPLTVSKIGKEKLKSWDSSLRCLRNFNTPGEWMEVGVPQAALEAEDVE